MKYLDLYGLFTIVDKSEYEDEEILAEELYSTYLDLDKAKKTAERIETFDGDEWLEWVWREWVEQDGELTLIFMGHIEENGEKTKVDCPYACFVIRKLGRLEYTDETLSLKDKYVRR